MPSITLKEALEVALRLQRSGQLAEAERVYRQILQQSPSSGDAQHLLGILCTQTGRAEEAIKWFRGALDRHPDVAPFQFSLATTLLAAGRAGEAAELYRRALAIDAGSAEGWSNLGTALIQMGQFDEAAECAQKALAIRKDYPEAIVVLGNAVIRMGHVDQAIAQFQAAVALKPDLTSAYVSLSQALSRRRRFPEALAATEKALSLEPNSAMNWNNFANALHDLGRAKEAAEAARRAIAIAPNLAEAHVNLSRSLQDLRKVDEAVAVARGAVELRGDLPQTHNVLANSLKDAGMVAEAIDEFERATQLAPAVTVDLSNKIYSMEFDPRADAKSLLAEQRKWNARFAKELTRTASPHVNDRSPDRRLRVGYVSPYFYAHSESFFVVPLLEHHDRGRFEVHCYSDATYQDHVTERMRRSVDDWQVTSGLSDLELAEKIRADGIDVLIDLTMHMGLNRSMTFARKPAPVQACWLAYPGGTGMDAMDYRISDPWIDPAGMDESCYHERTIRLAKTWVSYDPLSDAAPVEPREAGPIRFGSMNNPCKMNDPTLRLWAKVLRAVTDSRLIVQSISQMQRERILAVMGEEQIAAERIEFVGRCGRAEYLRRYDRIDIGLDPLPYNGITTTCDALWMGVPVITLAGKTAAGRAGVSILENVGLGEFAARDERQFVEIAERLAGDAGRLQQLRGNLRGSFEKSAMMDGGNFAREMEAAYRRMWSEWCASGV